MNFSDKSESENEQSDISESGSEQIVSEPDSPKEEVTDLSLKSNLKTQSQCICKTPIEVSSVAKMLKMLNDDINKITISNFSCLLTNIERCFNSLVIFEKSELTYYRITFADLFYRLRHEILGIMFMKSLSVESYKTDVPFSQYGIDSERTPDFIVIKDEHMDIFEISVSSNEEKAFQSKGVEEAGFESKYKREIDELRLKGEKVNYHVVYFNMLNVKTSNIDQILERVKANYELSLININILKSLMNGLSRITCLTREYLTIAASILFSREWEVFVNHNQLSQLYENSPFDVDYNYKDFHISFPVYQKINSLWFRLAHIKDRMLVDEPFCPYIDLSTNRLNFIHNKKGFQNIEFDEVIARGSRIAFFEKLLLKSGDNFKWAKDSDSGVVFTKKVQKSYGYNTDRNYLINESVEHTPELIDSIETDGFYTDYKKKLEIHTKSFFTPKWYDENYEQVLIKSICDMDESNSVNMDSETFLLPKDVPDCLAKCSMQDYNINEIINEVEDCWIRSNDTSVQLPIKNIRMKPSFILPIASLTQNDRCKLSFKNIDFIGTLIKTGLGGYTRVVLEKCLSEDYLFYSTPSLPSAELQENYNNRYKISNEITSIVKQKMKNNKNNRFNVNMLTGQDLADYNDLRLSISKINKLIKEMEFKEGIKKNIGMVRINSSGKSLMRQEFRNEMKHFKQKNVQSSIEGVGASLNGELISSQFDILIDLFSADCGNNDSFLIDNYIANDSKILQQLKTHTINEYGNLIKRVKDSYLGHSSAFISRMAHSLMFYSQLPFNNNYVRVDNLGYKNTLLIVRGGSKIFKTKSSKLFRLVFPISDELVTHYNDMSIGYSNYLQVIFEGVNYIITPWILMHENILVDSISFYPRIMSFCVLNSNPELSFHQNLTRYFLNILLSFHNRRATEAMLANLRYILLSTMGEFSAFPNILKELMGFNYDKLQFWLRYKLIKNYPNYFTMMKQMQQKDKMTQSDIVCSNLINIFTEFPIENKDDLALMIYSTFLMTKAPYQRPVERASNLKGILKIHTQFDKEVGLQLNCVDQLEKISVKNESNFINYSKKLFSSDFNIDPYFCTQLGIYTDSYFNNSIGKDQLLTEWIKIVNKNWDSMATTTGLRGFDEETFWGQKGYFIVYDYILNKKGYKDEMIFILNEDLTNDEKRKKIRQLNLTYAEGLNNIPDGLVFHAVDKRQWRGGREIYVMDMETKKMQQPIEKFMAYLCKKTDTELISVPSDKRSQVIHHSLFEKDIPDKELKSWFLTLDCSKWAPKSMFVKFALMIIPMQSIPVTFKNHFFNYLELLYSKRLYFNNAEVNVLLNNPSIKSQEKEYLISTKNKDGFYMFQPYSWVMGIFNYTSSFMHAFNQKYCNYIIKESSLLSFNEDCSINMYAHSDDSGGRITVSNKQMLIRNLFIYETLLKSCNHLLSRKKCVVSKIYFEILSIIYMFNELLALLPKFLGGIRFLPTDKGVSHDMLQSYSKCIELMVAGSDFSTAYMYMKFYSAEVWRFYHNMPPVKYDYKRPPQYLGMPDAHPLMVLLTGSDSDIIRIIFTEGYNGILKYYKFFRYFNMFDNDEGLIKPLKFVVKIRGVRKKFESSIEKYKDIINKWSLANVNYRNTVMDALTFLKRLSDPGFVGSLVNETDVRRISRAYFFRSGESINTFRGNISLKQVMSLLSDLNVLSEDFVPSFLIKWFGEDNVKLLKEEISPNNTENSMIIKYFKDVYANSLKLNDYLEKLDFDSNKLRTVIRTLKPTHLQIVKFGRGFSVDFDPSQLISYVYEPELSWALPNPNNLLRASEDFNSLLNHLGIHKEEIDASTAYKLVRNHQSKNVKEIYMYSSVPSQVRVIKNFSTLLTFLAKNSFTNTEIQGLSLNLRSSLTQAPIQEKDIDHFCYYVATLLDIIVSLGKHLNLISLEFRKIEDLNFIGGGVEDLLKAITDKRYTDPGFLYYQHYINYINQKYVLWDGAPNGEIFNDGMYYTFLREQKFRGIWYGKGVIAIYFLNNWVTMTVFNQEITDCEGDIVGKWDFRLCAFINDILKQNNINLPFNKQLSYTFEIREKLFLGYDYSGDISVDNPLNMRGGIPFEYKAVQHSFINQVKNSHITYIKENLFIAKSDFSTDLKINTIKIDRDEVLPILKSVVDEESLKDYLFSNSYDNFMDFVGQNLLTNYGGEHYISFNDLKEGFSGSCLYKMFVDIQTHMPNLIPYKFVTAKLPAPEGSLIRMMIALQNINNTEIIKMPKRVEPSILSIRNEYPENFSIILSEKMVEDFDKIYDNNDKLTIMTEFIEATNSANLDKIRGTILKLMCYWGYNSLVNVIQTYTFNKSLKNFEIFQVGNIQSNQLEYFNNYFIIMINNTFDTIEKVYNPNNKYDFPVHIIANQDITNLRSEYIIDLSYTALNYYDPYYNSTLSHLRLNNLLIALFKDADFVFNLEDSFKNHYPLNTLLLSPKSCIDYISVLNTLRMTFLNSIKNGLFDIKYHIPYFHLPHNSPKPLQTIKRFGLHSYKTYRFKWSNFLNDQLYSSLTRNVESFYINDQRYIVKPELIEIGKTKIPVSYDFKFESVLKESYLKSDYYDDLSFEMDSTDPDTELIESSILAWNKMYERTTIRKQGGSLIVPVKWVIAPYIEGNGSILTRLNNTGECVVLLSNCILRKFNCIRYSRCYLVNYSDNGELPDMVAHVMGVKHVPGEFWDKYIGGKLIYDQDSFSLVTHSEKIRTKNDIKDVDKLGFFIGEKSELESEHPKDLTDEKDLVKLWVKLNFSEEEAKKMKEEKERMDEMLNDMIIQIQGYEKNGVINKNKASEMISKYKNAIMSDLNLKPNLILRSFLTETELIEVNSGIISGEITKQIQGSDYIKMMQAPEVFGLAHTKSQHDPKVYKDNKYKIEIDSLHPKLGDLVASGNLTISTKMLKVLKNYYNTWKLAAEHTKFNKERKRFFLCLYMSLINSTSEHSSSKHDKIWQEVCNNLAEVIGEEPEEDIEDKFRFPPARNLRMKYRLIGVD